MKKLPTIPSKLIRLALEDLRKCEADPDYVINMNNWHFLTVDGTCSVCLAGAVMGQSLGGLLNHWMDPAMFEEENALFAIDAFHSGWIKQGLGYLGFESKLFGNRNMPPYENNLEMFHTQMHIMADDLEAAGC